MPVMGPVISWTVVAVGVGAGYIYYRGVPQFLRQTAQSPSPTVNDSTSRQRNDPKSRRARETAGNTQSRDASRESSKTVTEASDSASTDNGLRQKRGKHKKMTSQPSKLREVVAGGQESSDDGMNDHDFARQMASTQEGTSFAPSQKAAQRVRTEKQSKIDKGSRDTPDYGSPNQVSTTASSVGGTGSEDDIPKLETSSIETVASVDPTGVADMLEPAAPGPAILRVTSPENPFKEANRQRQQKVAPPPPETKKQRQNRKKKENEKIAREAAEKVRRDLMEKQMKSARDAERAAAKKASVPAPTSSVWNKPQNGGMSTTQAIASSQLLPPATLLDTFDDANPSSTVAAKNGSLPSSNEVVDGATNADRGTGQSSSGMSGNAQVKNSIMSDYASLSEEDQSRLLREAVQEEEWKPVKSKRSRSKKAEPES